MGQPYKAKCEGSGVLARTLRLFSRDRRGNVAPLMALLLVPIIGAMGVGIEASSWFMMQRAQQNAADAAALAAATNGDTTYLSEARGVASNYGYVQGVAQTTVTGTDAAVCPDDPTGPAECYEVTITRNIPLYLVQLVYAGNSTIAGAPSTTIAATAIARAPGGGQNYCMIGLQTTGEAIRTNGGPKLDLTGCDLRSNSNLVCNGAQSDTGVTYGVAAGTSNCGTDPMPGEGVIADPFGCASGACLRNQIPPNDCANKTVKAGYSTGNTITGNLSPAPGKDYIRYCGNVTLSGNVTIGGTATKVVIFNGSLDLNGHTFTGSDTTLIFSGVDTTDNLQNTNPVVYNHAPVFPNGKGGTLTLAGPTSGSLKGIALMQDENLSGWQHSLDMEYSGTKAHLNISGLVYLPHGNFEISGDIHPTALHCIGVVANTILINGEGKIFADLLDGNPTDACGGYLDLPKTPGSRQSLVG